jgi:ATP-binding cassette, subfamily B, bacterial
LFKRFDDHRSRIMSMNYCVGMSMAIDWEDEEPPPLDRRLVRRVFGAFAPYYRLGALTLLFLLVGTALGLAPALLAKSLIDELASPSARFERVLLLVLAAVGTALISGLVGLAEEYLRVRISEGIIADLRGQLFDKLIGQSVGFYTRNRSGEVLSRITNDVGRLDDVVSGTIFGLVSSLLTVITTVALMFWLDWRLTLIALLGLPLAILPSRRIGRSAYQASQRTQEKVGDLTAYVQEIIGISGILLVKAFSRERAERARFGELNDEVRRFEVHQAMIGNSYGMVMRALAATGPALVWLFGGYLVVHDRVSLGTVIILGTVLTIRLYGAIAELGGMHVNVVGSLALFGRIFALIDLPFEIAEKPDARPLGRSRGAVALENVTFAYSNTEQPAVDDVSFTIEPGQLVALVGPSGAGKTTTASLVPRFYDPQSGRVLIDGGDVRDVTLESLAQNIGVVFQDTFLFHASIRENLLYAQQEASETNLIAAARAAHLHEFICSLPEGYDTIVGERGHRLSGGEKQRLALAQVILKDPPILILDEATSHLDSVSEQLIQAALKPLFAGRTSIVIAHRLSTILAADLILVLDHGSLVEQGTHVDLLRQGGLYATLYDRQFRVSESQPALVAV